MNIVIFGLSISSAWGNGHATLLRGLFRALHGQGHEVHFFEKDVPYYAAHRDSATFPFAHLHLYSEWNENLGQARDALRSADAGIVTSYCPDGAAACDLILNTSLGCRIFYDMDTPVTLTRLQNGDSIPYLPSYGLGGFDLVLSYTGGQALSELRERLGAKVVEPLYGWVDPDLYVSVTPIERYVADLSYLGTYSLDRQAALETLLLHPALLLGEKQFVIGGAMYPDPSRWTKNVRHYDHVAPPEHPAFYSSSALTLNVTRGAMAAMGFCPSGRLFEAAACGTAVVSDWWEGLDAFFTPGEEILIATSTAEAITALTLEETALRRVAARARERTLDSHTAQIRAKRLTQLIESPADESLNSQEVYTERGA